jgi:hypothetical protein
VLLIIAKIHCGYVVQLGFSSDAAMKENNKSKCC